MLKRLNWDSNFFGKEIYECDIHGLSEAERLPRGSYIQIRVNKNDYETIALLELHKFDFLDYHLEYKLSDLDRCNQGDWQNLVIERNNLTTKTESAGELFVLNSRFNYYANHNKIVDFYNEWLINSKLGRFDDELLVYRLNESEIGFSTTRYLEKCVARIGLFGIFPDFQGKGFGKKVLCKLITMFKENGISEVLIATQGKNKNAQNLYESFGFELVSKHAIYCKEIGEKNDSI